MDNKKMKIGILTFHMAHNYGAMLQAYSLTTAIRRLGFDCEVIDYRFSYIDNWSRIRRINDLIFEYGVVNGSLRFIKRLLTGYYWPKSMHVKFDKFEREIIPHSDRIYRNKNELDNMPYDVIMFGSDQIWNSALTDGIAEEYIGGFKCNSNTRKIAYAASCGTSDFQEESKEIYDKLLDDYYAISVREEEFQKSLISRGYNVECVLDPTLLLNEEEWKSLISNKKMKNKREYLLLYVFDEDEEVYELAREYAKKKGLGIIAIAYQKKKSMYGMDVLTECGPLDFLSLFANASHIITTSFHGTVFSIIFHKDFHCIPHTKYRERTDSLLKMLELGSHNVNDLKEFEDVETNWNEVDVILEKRKTKSVNFIKESIIGYK